ncbi:hypothetical protein GWI33_006884, partial [Rhynchophorus ferrugineus]
MPVKSSVIDKASDRADKADNADWASAGCAEA